MSNLYHVNLWHQQSDCLSFFDQLDSWIFVRVHTSTIQCICDNIRKQVRARVLLRSDHYLHPMLSLAVMEGDGLEVASANIMLYEFRSTGHTLSRCHNYSRWLTPRCGSHMIRMKYNHSTLAFETLKLRKRHITRLTSLD